MIQCAAQEINICASDGATTFLPVTDIFQNYTGAVTLNTASVTPNGQVDTTSTIYSPNTNQSISIDPDGLRWTQNGMPTGAVESFTVCATDGAGDSLCCTFNLRISDCSTGGGGTTSSCTNAGPFYVTQGQTLDIPILDVHTSGIQPSWVSETTQNITSILGLSPIRVRGDAIGSNTISLQFGSEVCQVEIIVQDATGGGGTGVLCRDIGVVPVPLGGTQTLFYQQISSALNITPVVISESVSNIVNFTAMAPDITLEGLAIGTTTVVFDFNGDQCPVKFEVIDPVITGNCPFGSCNQLLMSVDGGVESNGTTYNLDCNTQHTISVIIPNPNNLAFDADISIPNILTDGNGFIFVSSFYDSARGVTVANYSLTTKSTGCGVTSPLSFEIIDTGNGAFVDCGVCQIGTLVSGDCPDCVVNTGGGGTTCLKSSTLEDKPSTGVTSAGAGEILILGPAGGCDCAGCVFEWKNHPDNPEVVPIEDGFSRTLRLRLPSSLADGEYKFIPDCCNCD